MKTSIALFVSALALLSNACEIPVDGTQPAPCDTTSPDPSATPPPTPDETTMDPTTALKSGWSTSGKLTAGQGITTGQTVTLQADFAKVNRAGAYTIQFAVKPPTIPSLPANPNVFVAPEALVTWTVEGNQVQRRLSIGDGATISGDAQAVKIIAFDNTQIDNTPALQYDVTINIVPGTRPATPSPPSLQLYDPRPTGPNISHGTPGMLVDLADPVSLPIPPEAGATAVFINAYKIGGGAPAPGDGLVAITFNGAGSYTFNVLDFLLIDASQLVNTWIPLPEGANTITLQAAGTNQLFYSAMLGIDG